MHILLLGMLLLNHHHKKFILTKIKEKSIASLVNPCAIMNVQVKDVGVLDQVNAYHVKMLKMMEFVFPLVHHYPCKLFKKYYFSDFILYTIYVIKFYKNDIKLVV